MQAVPDVRGVTAEQFNDEILAAGRPVVLRGLVADWPVVRAARRSKQEFCRYIKQFDRGLDVDTAYGPPSIAGRLFYNDDLSGLNCRMGRARLSSSLDHLLEHADDDPAPTLAVQSVVIGNYLPGLAAELPLPLGLVPDHADSRLWLGSRAIVAAHYDASENIACCVAGSRRFTLFPPAQVANLYVGPFEMTPAGATISMVDFDHPDYASYPLFREAEAAGYETVLEPGDAIYIPYMWWHHVRSREAVNGLVNYWWSRAPAHMGDPRNALVHAIAAMRTMPGTYREAWRGMFEHYVFGPGEPGAHLPPGRRGILGAPDADELKQLKKALSRALSRD